MTGKKSRERKRIAALALAMAAGMAFAAYGGEWKQDNIGWVYQNDDGSYQMNGWFTDVNGKSYYFNEQGYMLYNTITPDGQRVGGDQEPSKHQGRSVLPGASPDIGFHDFVPPGEYGP